LPLAHATRYIHSQQVVMRSLGVGLGFLVMLPYYSEVPCVLGQPGRKQARVACCCRQPGLVPFRCGGREEPGDETEVTGRQLTQVLRGSRRPELPVAPRGRRDRLDRSGVNRHRGGRGWQMPQGGGKQPRCCGATEQSKELAAFHVLIECPITGPEGVHTVARGED